jgi:hypothetical protein
VLTTSAQTNLAATSSATFDVTGLCAFGGIELPPSARAPLILRPFEEELWLAMRHWEKSYDYAIAPGSVTHLGEFYVRLSGTPSRNSAMFDYGARKRVAPNVSAYSPVSGANGYMYDGSTDISINTMTAGEARCSILSNAPSSSDCAVHFVANARMS